MLLLQIVTLNYDSFNENHIFNVFTVTKEVFM